MNKTILMGRLTKDPEVKYFQNENSTARSKTIVINAINPVGIM